MDILSTLNKVFIDFFAYIPWAILKILLWLSYMYLYDPYLFYDITTLIKAYEVEVVIIVFGLLYFLDIVFSFFSSPFKISRAILNDDQIAMIIKDNSDLLQVLEYQKWNKKSFTSSLLDVSNKIWYEVPMFFENKILLFKSLRNTLIVFSYTHIIFIMYYILYFEFKILNILIFSFVWLVYLIFIYLIRKEIEEYKLWYISALLNINFYLVK